MREYTHLLMKGFVTSPIVNEALKESSRELIRRVLINFYTSIIDNSSGNMKRTAELKLRVLEKNYKNCDFARLVNERYY